MIADDYYGFFSPRFKSKTGLDSSVIFEFIENHADSSDVFLFSPFFDQCAFANSVFHQGAVEHAGILQTFKDCVSEVAPAVDFDGLMTDSRNTVFCNYFVAKPGFWMDWLNRCERIFNIAEAEQADLARRLNSNTNYWGGGTPTKVLVIERIASLILATQRGWKAKSDNPIALPWSSAPTAKFPLEMAFLDALKIAYSSERHPQYLDAFHRLRQAIIQQLQQPNT